MSAQPLVVFFKDIDKNDVSLVGGKGANLGEMVKAGFPVPNGFAITVPAYDLFFRENFLDKKIYEILDNTNVNDPNELNQASRQIQKMINNAQIPDVLIKEVFSSYKKLSGLFKQARVAVRSSATAEDMANASFAGQQASFLNTKGEANLLLKVKECWASLFTPRSIFYRVENKIPHRKVKISVLVQKMIESEVSGVMFSMNPITNEKDQIIIEAVWGLGEMIVQGSVIPDKYVVQKETFSILSKEISDQSIQLIRVGTETKEEKVPPSLIGKQKITDDEIIKLAKISDSMQKHYYFPQDSEWAKEKERLYLVQTRPITGMSVSRKINSKVDTTTDTNTMPILTGSPASPGIATGQVKILKSPKEIGKIEKGDVLVAPMTSPDYVPAMKKASAIITDQGGQTSHAAIVSRELGVPCVVGTKEATTKLKDGILVTVNGQTGQVFLGSKAQAIADSKEQEIKESKHKTATKIYVNLAEPERAKEVSKLPVDGVGLLRAEFMIANIGVHPKEAIKNMEQDKFIEKLTNGLKVFAESFKDKPVIYRATDFKTNEYRTLPGGIRWEPVEPNPMLGFRGAFRYIQNPEVFRLELTAIKNVRKHFDNLHLMIPFVRSPQELAKVRRMVEAEGLFDDNSFKFWMMVELPVNVILLEDFLNVGVDGVSIGSNDLTMLIEGVDRDNSEVASEFNEQSEAILWALKRIISTCSKKGITCSICGQAPSEHEDLVKFLVKEGITSISVNPDAVINTREIVYNVEKEII